MSNILIFKFVTGDIVAADSTYNKKDGTYFLENPLEVYFKRTPTGGSMIGLYPWLIREVILANNCIIEENKVLSISHPTAKFAEYYEVMNSMFDKKNDPTFLEKQLDEIIEYYKHYDDSKSDHDDFMEEHDDELEEEIEIPKIRRSKDKKYHWKGDTPIIY